VPALPAGVFFALASAAVWGAGDFSGGLAARRSHQLQVLVLSALSGLVMMIVLAVAWGERLPGGDTILWAALAGASGAVGIAALYHGLSLGNAAAVAPTAAVISAAVPVLFTAAFGTPPGAVQLVGFLMAMAGIWLVAAAGSSRTGRDGLRSAIVAGLGFGGFFVLLGQIEESGVFAPLVVSRAVAVAGGALMLASRGMPMPSLFSNPVGLLAGLLDAGGNVFYLLAQQHTRLDVAAVLSSFYPVTTVLLAWIVLKERVAARQWAGAALCLAATFLIAR
jgi:drug/metabolite transporter (DMT)-like permease